MYINLLNTVINRNFLLVIVTRKYTFKIKTIKLNLVLI